MPTRLQLASRGGRGDGGGSVQGRDPAALGHRDFQLLLGGQAISNTGDWLYNVSLIVYVLDVTHAGTWVAATNLVRFLPYVLFGTFGGVIADRYDRKRVIIGTDLARAVALIGAFADAEATLISGGTAQGVSTLAADVSSTVHTVRSVGYLPAALPDGVAEDDRCDGCAAVMAKDSAPPSPSPTGVI